MCRWEDERKSLQLVYEQRGVRTRVQHWVTKVKDLHCKREEIYFSVSSLAPVGFSHRRRRGPAEQFEGRFCCLETVGKPNWRFGNDPMKAIHSTLKAIVKCGPFTTYMCPVWKTQKTRLMEFSTLSISISFSLKIQSCSKPIVITNHKIQNHLVLSSVCGVLLLFYAKQTLGTSTFISA